MRYETIELQGRLAALGFDPGDLDGVRGPVTTSALKKAMSHHGVTEEKQLFHGSGVHRIHWHWTAGAEGVIDFERRPYHVIIDEDGFGLKGLFKPEDNASPVVPGSYAPHTFNFNGNAIGVSIDAMDGATERPFSWGPNPIREVQVEGLVRETAALCRRFWIPVSRWSTLSHSEVQPTFGVRQKWKWDINVLPGMDKPGDPIDVGDKIRAMVREELGELQRPEAGEVVDEDVVDDETWMRWRLAEIRSIVDKTLRGRR